jgi:hypothetical protein
MDFGPTIQGLFRVAKFVVSCGTGWKLGCIFLGEHSLALGFGSVSSIFEQCKLIAPPRSFACLTRGLALLKTQPMVSENLSATSFTEKSGHSEKSVRVRLESKKSSENFLGAFSVAVGSLECLKLEVIEDFT